jgi:D-3-phosphoglycerate dehydrogenase / 2-oxoglutarate reductase
MFKVLLTCPPMINQIDLFKDLMSTHNIQIDIPSFTQVMTEEKLINILPNYDGWIIGDDPATRKVFESGKKGNLKAAVKWGVGTDNVDFEACKDLNIPITNIPGVFGEEVSDVAIGMLLNLTRKLHMIDTETKKGNWIKPCGNSLSGKKVCLIGFGDIGRCTARKLLSFNLNVYVSDPGFEKIDGKIICKYNKNIIVPENIQKVHITNLDDALNNCDFVIVTCVLNKHTYHLINKDKVMKCKKGVKIINVARGPIVKEDDVVELLEKDFISAVGFDVFVTEPLPDNSKLRYFPQNFYGSHNGSNTIEGVIKTSTIAIEKIKTFLNVNR